MKRFRFPLQPVTTLRAHRESRAREVLGAAIQAAVEAERQRDEAQERVARFEAALSAGRASHFHPAEVSHQLQGYRREKAVETEAEKALTNARDLVNRRQGEYLEAHRQLEVVQRLEGKARLAHRFAANREEQTEYDEFSSRAAAVRRTRSISP